jgi:hypothetical protein
MIIIKHWRKIVETDGDSTEAEVTFGGAVNDLLTLYASFKKPTVGSGNYEAVTRNGCGVGMQGLTGYKPSPKHDYTAYGKFDRVATLLGELTFAYQHPDDPESNLDHLRKVASYQARGRTTIEPTEESYSNYQAILDFIIQWLLERELKLSLDTPDKIAAALLALEQELDGGAKFEVTLAELPAA